jgi:hypothetical protein
MKTRVTSKMTSDMVSLCTNSPTGLPLACQTKVVSAFTTDVIVAKVVVECFGIGKGLGAFDPLAG